MTLPKGLFYLLSGPAGSTFAQSPVGKLVPMILMQDAALPFTRLDLFDQSLRRSGRLLLDTGTDLKLMMADGVLIAQPLPHPQTLVADMADGPVKQMLADLSPLRRLLPCGSGTFASTAIGFVDDVQKIRCRAASHTLTSTDGRQATLVHLKGLRGYGQALADALEQIKTCGGHLFDMEDLHQLLFPLHPVPQGKPTVALRPDQSAFEAATQIIAGQVPIARQNEPGIIADLDTEFLHDYRIALRKIRSVLSLFKGVYLPDQTANLKTRFSTLMALTGPLRDLDVLLLERAATYDMVPQSLHDGLDAMFALRKTERSAALTKLRRHLSGSRYLKTMADLADVFTTPGVLDAGPKATRPVHDYAATLIWQRFQKARKIAGHLSAETPDAAVHALRIHCKKLRYLMEFSTSLYPQAQLNPAIKTLKRLQDNLGTANDIAVQLLNLQTFLRGADAWSQGAGVQIAQSVGALTLVLHQRKQAARQQTQTLVAGFASPHTQQIFRDLFHPRKPKP